MSKKALIARLSWYFPAERLGMVMFCGVFAHVAVRYPIGEALFLLYGLAVMVYVLFQGQKYWGLKLALLTGQPVEQARHLAFFRRAKTHNNWLCGLMPGVFLLQISLAGTGSGSRTLLLFAFLANGFGILEHVNYYYRQLMIDNLADLRYLWRYQRLKVASLAKDLAEGKL